MKKVLKVIINFLAVREDLRLERNYRIRAQRRDAMLAPQAQREFIGWEPVSSCINRATFATKKTINLNFIQCYAVTNDAKEEKDDFYHQLQDMLAKTGAKDITVLMGDFKDRVRQHYEEVLGVHGLRQMSPPQQGETTVYSGHSGRLRR